MRHLAPLWLALPLLGLLIAPKADAQAETLCSFGRHAEDIRVQGLRAEASPRPPSASSVASETLPIVVHFESVVTEAYAREVLTYAETTWRVLFVEKGFQAPHPDGDLGGDARFDLYIVTTLPTGVGGYAGFSGYFEETPRADAIGYLVIANELDMRLRRFVVAHEMFHASQMAYDWWEDLAFMEGSATWVVDQVFDDEDIYWRYFPYFNAEPFKALDFISMMGPYQYGMGLFSLFLDERYGRGDALFMRSLWERSIQDGTDNEPDFLDAAAALAETEGGLDSVMREFGVWRLLVGTRKAYGKFGEVGIWDDRMNPFIEVDMPAGVISAAGRPVNTLHPLSHAFLRFARRATERGSYTLAVTGEGATRFAVDVVQITNDQATVFRGPIVGDGDTGELSLPRVDGQKELIYVVTNLGETTHDVDTTPWLGRFFRYDFQFLAR